MKIRYKFYRPICCKGMQRGGPCVEVPRPVTSDMIVIDQNSWAGFGIASVLCGISLAMMVVLALVLYIMVCIFRMMQWHKRRHPKSRVLPIDNSRLYRNPFDNGLLMLPEQTSTMDSFNWNTSLDEGLEISSSNHTNYIEKAESQFNASDLDLLQQRQGEMAIEFTSSEDVQTLVHTSSEDFAKIPINQI